MGPNGSGKTTLAYALMGHPAYVVKSGEVLWKGYNLLKLSPDKRSRLGLFLAFQYPTAVPGLSVASFIRSAVNAKLQGIDKNPDVDPTDSTRGGISMLEFRRTMREKMALLKVEDSFAARYVNDGFSGGEKKRLEMLQMAMLDPEFAILDETDSGLDIDALRIVAEGVNAMLNPNMGVLLITHYQRLLNYITPDYVHVLAVGRIVTSGGKDLALRLEEEGYGPILRENGLEIDVPDEALAVPQEPEAAAAGRSAGDDDDRGAPDRDHDPSAASHAPSTTTDPVDPERLRLEFPILDQQINGHPFVYLDSASTSQKPLVVLEAMDTYYREYNANVHRGIYTIGERATAEYEKARAKTARLVGVADAHEIVFARNATEAINLVAYSWGRKHIGRGDVIVLTEMEHHANLVPWQPRPGEGRRPRVHPDHRRRDPAPGRVRRPARARAQAGRVHPRVEHAGHDQPDRGHDAPGPRGRRAGADRRRPGRTPRPGRHRGHRLRLLRLQRPQDARRRPDRARCGAGASCSRRCPRSSPAAR